MAVSLGVSGDVALTAPGTYHSGTSTCEHTHPGSAIVVSSWASPSIVANMQQEHSHNQSNGVQAVKDVVTGGVNGRRCGGLGGGGWGQESQYINQWSNLARQVTTMLYINSGLQEMQYMSHCHRPPPLIDLYLAPGSVALHHIAKHNGIPEPACTSPSNCPAPGGALQAIGHASLLPLG